MLYLMPEPKVPNPSQKCRGATLQVTYQQLSIPSWTAPQPGQSNMDRLGPARIGLSLAITMGLLYLLCALMVALAPGPVSATLVGHGMNVAPLMQRQALSLSQSAVPFGLLALMALSFIAGLLSGLLKNVMRVSSPHP